VSIGLKLARGLFATMLERADTKEAIALTLVAPWLYSTSYGSKDCLPRHVFMLCATPSTRNSH